MANGQRNSCTESLNSNMPASGTLGEGLTLSGKKIVRLNQDSGAHMTPMGLALSNEHNGTAQTISTGHRHNVDYLRLS